jgi:uncharacterized iron-regulated protein
MSTFLKNMTRNGSPCFVALLAGFWLIAGCAAERNHVLVRDLAQSFPAETIISAGRVVDPASMLADLQQAQIIYVGERHNDARHHAWQLRILRELRRQDPELVLGMEMFDSAYQPVLDNWAAGRLDRRSFLEQVHWYANWRFPYDLYEDILNFVRDQHVRLFGLNLPFHIPRKIAVGGIRSLSPEEKKYIAADIDTSIAAHREYIREIYEIHRLRGVDRFEYFYLAQCAGEDTMAANVVRHLNGRKMLVLAGNGHIVRKFGIPDRAYRRNGASFRTVYLATAGSEVETGFADYIIVTGAASSPRAFAHGTD